KGYGNHEHLDEELRRRRRARHQARHEDARERHERVDQGSRGRSGGRRDHGIQGPDDGHVPVERLTTFSRSGDTKMNILETLLASARGGALGRAAETRGLGTNDVQALLGQLVPALTAQMTRNASEDDGRGLASALGRGNHARYLD